jgi:transglutaminase-like putative cysteine protease
LLLIIFLTTYALELTYWTYDLNRITAVGLLSLFSGLFIGISSFRKKCANFLAFLYGVAIYLWQLVFSLSSAPLWMDRLLEYRQRVTTTWQQLMRNVPLEDGILFLSGACLLFCACGLSAGIRLGRHRNPWVPLSFFMAAFFSIQLFLPESQRKYLLVLIFVVVFLVLLGRLAYLDDRRRWRRNQVREDPNASAVLLRSVVLFAVILGLISFGGPLLYRRISDQEPDEFYYRREYSTSWELLRNFFFPLRQQSGFGEGGFSDAMILGVSRSEKETPVFNVQVPPNTSPANRFYWRARVYDTYQNGYWQSSPEQVAQMENPEWAYAGSMQADIYPFLFDYKQASEIVVIPPLTLYVERTVEVSYYELSGGERDVLMVTDPALVRSGESVLVEGGLNQPGMELLRQAGGDYPAQIRARYLQLPPDLPAAVKALAEDLTRTDETAIDKAVSVTSYLRSTYSYQDHVNIPEGEDPLEWFLFRGRQGFCNYFASAEVLMLRSLGIPTRLAVGYTQGERSGDGSMFAVRVYDSHAWAEAFFPGVGWIILEATPLEPNVEYAEAEEIEEQPVDPRERIALQNPDPQQAEELWAFQRISEKYAAGEAELVVQEFTYKNILSWLALLVGLGGLGFVFLHSFVFREEQHAFPLVIQRRLQEKGRKSPAWMEKWAAYEELDRMGKLYAKVKLFSKLVLPVGEKEETPKEFLRRLFTDIDLPEEERHIFMDAFHQDTYGRETDGSDPDLPEIYRAILKGIFNKLGTNFKEAILFRIKLLRIR